MKKPKQKKVRMLNKYFQSMEKQINRYIDNIRKLQKTTVLQKSKGVQKREFNNIFEWLKVLDT